MGRISQVSVNNYTAATTADTTKNTGDNNLYNEKLVFSASELGLNGKRPATIVLTERQVETKIFQKYGFNTRDKIQTAMLKLRFDTKGSPFEEINWSKGQFVARLNANGQYEITVGLREKTLEALSGRLLNAPSSNTSGTTDADPNVTTASRLGINSADYRRRQIENKLNPSLEGLTPEQQDLVLDLTQVGLSVVGIFDPTGVADGADAIISLGRGDYWGAGISALGIIPYLGDLAKIGKLPKLLKIIENVVGMAKTDAKFAKVVEPLLKGLKNALDNLPIHKLPDWAKKPIESLKNKIDEFFSAAKKLGKTEPSLPPNPNRVPEGNPKKPKLKDDEATVRSITRENESAKTLAEHGYNIKQLPDNVKGSVQKVKKPDFEIEGKVFDNFAPSTSSARNIATVLSEKILDPKTGLKQADRFVLNLNDSAVTLEQMEKQLKNFPVKDLKELIIIKNGKVIPFFPFK